MRPFPLNVRHTVAIQYTWNWLCNFLYTLQIFYRVEVLYDICLLFSVFMSDVTDTWIALRLPFYKFIFRAKCTHFHMTFNSCYSTYRIRIYAYILAIRYLFGFKTIRLTQSTRTTYVVVVLDYTVFTFVLG